MMCSPMAWAWMPALFARRTSLSGGIERKKSVSVIWALGGGPGRAGVSGWRHGMTWAGCAMDHSRAGPDSLKKLEVRHLYTGRKASARSQWN